jgi:hypothetical protein
MTPVGVLRTSIALGIVAAAAACSGGDKELAQPKVDDTAREVSQGEVSRMALSLEQFGLEFDEFVAEDGNGPLTLDSAAAGEFDPVAERADLEGFGWALGHEAFFADAEAIEGGTGTFIVGSSVGLFNDLEGAVGYFDDAVGELGEDVGKTSDGVTLKKTERFEAEGGDEAAGARLEAHFEQVLTEEERQELEDQGVAPVSFDFWGAAVVLRHGRLMGVVSLAGIGLSDGEKERLEGRLKDLSRKLDEGMTAVLARGAPATATP